MRKLMLAFGCAAMVVPTMMIVPVSEAGAQRYRNSDYRGTRGRVRCKRNNGTTGAIVGGVGGALLGRTVDTRGDRTVGTLGGAALGALAGREVERSTSTRNRRCR